MAFWVLSAGAHKTMRALPARINLRGRGERERRGERGEREGEGEGDALIRQPLISILQCNK